MTLCITSLSTLDRFADFLACLSLNDCGSHLWAEDVGDAVWHHGAVVS